MKKEHFDSYATFIFGVLSKLEKRIDISNYSTQEARVYGYLSELLMDIWVETNEICFKEIHWYQLGNKHMIKKIFYFVCRKFGLKIGSTHL